MKSMTNQAQANEIDDDTYIFENSFGSWLGQHGVEIGDILTEHGWESHVDMNVLKVAITKLLHKERLRGKLDAAQYISNKLPAEEPTIIASRRTEDEDMIWVKAQMAFADFFGDEIGSYERDLIHQLEALEREKTDE